MIAPRRKRLASLAPGLPMLTTRTVAPMSTGVGSAGAGSGWQGKRGSSTALGYGADWRARRLQVLEADPLCRPCAETGRVTQATEVHHLESFTSLADPRRLAWANLCPICKPCHLAASARQSRGR
jgi:5-methylcytosine-specific restriction protein A